MFFSPNAEKVCCRRLCSHFWKPSPVFEFSDAQTLSLFVTFKPCISVQYFVQSSIHGKRRRPFQPEARYAVVNRRCRKMRTTSINAPLFFVFEIHHDEATHDLRWAPHYSHTVQAVTGSHCVAFNGLCQVAGTSSPATDDRRVGRFHFQGCPPGCQRQADLCSNPGT